MRGTAKRINMGVRSFFRLQARHPLPFAVVLPAILIALVAVGWTRDDIVEKEVSEIWIRKSGQYHEDKEYADAVRGETGGQGRGGTSNFAAMAVARDGGSLFTADRLEEIRKRMEIVERETKVEYKGNEFAYDDLCASNNVGEGTTYKTPCFRLSPMDYFREAEWFFDEEDRVTYYKKVYQDLVVAPRLERFGALTQVCLPPEQNAEWCETNDQPALVNCSCAHTYRLRTEPAYAVENGYPASYANPFSLFSDIGNLENNDRCKICIEEGFEGIITQLSEGMAAMLNLYKAKLQQLIADESSTEDDVAKANEELAMIERIELDLSRESIETFNHYFTARGLYAEFGAAIYRLRYADGMATADPNTGVTLSGLCMLFRQDPDYCAASIDLPTAKEHLTRHADNAFSSINAGGLPFPFFGETADGSTALFAGTDPFGGSGIDLSGGESLGFPGQPLQGLGYLMPLAASDEPLSFNSTGYQLLATDPMLVWYKSALVDAGDVKCANENIPGTSFLGPIDAATAQGMADVSPQWCTKFNNNGTETQQSQQDVARMWYDLLVDSDSFLRVAQGATTPYSWTMGQGCGYQLMGQRFSYTGQSEEDILSNMSNPLYYWDEGEILGVLDKALLIAGDTDSVFQSGYFFLSNPEDIAERVSNCNRPGGPIPSLTADDARELLYRFKQTWEESWSEGWNDDSSSNVTFSGFFDDSGAVGTTGRMLDEITLSSGTLMTISFIIIIVVSALFLFSFDVVRSRVLLTIVGVLLVILTFFAALGVAILSGLKLNITVGWTLPFILIGIGVDDMYIVSLALTNTLTENAFVEKMASVVSPVTMTSLVVFSMFAVMNVSDIPAVYVTARCGMISVAFLWLMMITCFPAYCYLDIKRQNAGRCDVLFCMKKGEQQTDADSDDTHRGMSGFVYDFVYKPLVIKDGIARLLFGMFVLAASLALLGVSIWGLVSRTTIGLGLEDFFPDSHQASVWAHESADHLASWPITMNWGALDYGNPDVQLKMIKQFEDVLRSPHVSETETIQLWIANFLIWTTRHCDQNFVKQYADRRECGMDQVYQTDNSTCAGEWVRNDISLSNKVFIEVGKDECVPLEGGICRPASQMHHEDLAELQAKGLYDPTVDDGKTSYCPVFRSTSEEKLKWCVERWREMTGGVGNLVLIEGTDSESATCPGETVPDGEIQSPIPLSQGPIMFGKDLFSHEETVALIEETRAFCDDDPEIHCWMTGVPYDYFEQYLYVDSLLAQIGGYALLAVFCVSMAFLLLKVGQERRHSKLKTLVGSSVGSGLIALTGLISMVTVSGLSSLAGVSLTSFSVMSYVLSAGYATEYSVHIVHRWLRAPSYLGTSKDRVEHTMEFLFLPTFLSFVSSTVGILCLAFTEFHFNEVYFFRPLLIVALATYFYGCYLLPFVLSVLDFDVCKLGTSTSGHESQADFLPADNDGIKSPRSDDEISKAIEGENEEGSQGTIEGPTLVIPQTEKSDDAR